MYELYSRRIKNAAGEPEVYEYDTFSDAFRNQVFYALSDVFDFFKYHRIPNMWKFLHNSFSRELGVKCLFHSNYPERSQIEWFVGHASEDNVSGKLSDDRFARMSATYEKEQGELEASTAELRTQIETGKQQEVNVKSFLKLVKSYTEPQKLTLEILHMFIEKIVVHDPDWSSGHRIQQIDIHYNFVGQLDMSVEMTRTRRRNKKKNRNILSTYQQAI